VVLTDRGRGVVRLVNPPFARALDALEANLDAPVPEVRAVLLGILDALERADAELAVDPVPAGSQPTAPLADTSSS
jgi:hypothetical protein